jgi:KDO2-lipid IV(A) lauroyltransferase
LIARLAHFVFWLLGRLPLASLQRLGAALGRFWVRTRRREAKVAAINLALCFPELDTIGRERLLVATLEGTGQTASELPWLWTRGAERVLGALQVVAGESLFLDAIAARRGLIVAAPHLGAWEALNLYLSRAAPIAILYRPPRMAWVEALINRCRGRFGAEPVRAEASGVRTLMRRLKDGGVVGILPDQQPKVGEGEFASFFGRPTLTMTLLPKLAQKTGSRVLFAWAERLPAGAGYAIRFSDHGEIRDTAALNAAVEALARTCPAQYQWTYKRFGKQPDGSISPYRSPSNAPIR